MRTFILTLLLLTTSCCKERLIVYTEAVTFENLASYHVGTPDPRLGCPDRGQRLVIAWHLPDCKQGGVIQGRIRFRNLKEINVTFPVKEQRGHMTYNVVNQDYCTTGGILAYYFSLYQDDILVEESIHSLWTELIQFNE